MISINQNKLTEIQREEFKVSRQSLIDNLEVTYNGIIYQADEVSQSRLSISILTMIDTDTREWVAKDNSVHTLTKLDLESILKLAEIAKSNIWTQ